MRIAIIQPCFVPWAGYFEQIAAADLFVYMDDVQYTKKDWRNTNQLKTPYGIKKIYVPVNKVTLSTLIQDVTISYNENWEDALMNKLKEWYKKSPYYKEIIELIIPTIYGKYEKLVDFNFNLNNDILSFLGINTPIRFSHEIPRYTNDRNERIIEICKFFKADILYDGKSAEKFIDIDLFRQNGIEVVFQNYQHTPYKQLWGPFIPYMSVLDLLMNEGKNAKGIIMSSPLPDWVIKPLP